MHPHRTNVRRRATLPLQPPRFPDPEPAQDPQCVPNLAKALARLAACLRYFTKPKLHRSNSYKGAIHPHSRQPWEDAVVLAP